MFGQNHHSTHNYQSPRSATRSTRQSTTITKKQSKMPANTSSSHSSKDMNCTAPKITDSKTHEAAEKLVNNRWSLTTHSLKRLNHDRVHFLSQRQAKSAIQLNSSHRGALLHAVRVEVPFDVNAPNLLDKSLHAFELLVRKTLQDSPAFCLVPVPRCVPVDQHQCLAVSLEIIVPASSSSSPSA